MLWRGRAAFYAACSGVCFGTDLALWHTSIVHTSVALSTLLVNTTPIYVGLYTMLVLRESLDRRFTTGAGLALLGTVVLLGVPEEGPGQLTGAALALFAAVFYAGYLLLMRAARQEGIDTVSALLVQFDCLPTPAIDGQVSERGAARHGRTASSTYMSSGQEQR